MLRSSGSGTRYFVNNTAFSYNQEKTYTMRNFTFNRTGTYTVHASMARKAAGTPLTDSTVFPKHGIYSPPELVATAR